MSKEVKRYVAQDIRDHTPTDAWAAPNAIQMVDAKVYDALLAERDALREALIYARKEAVYGLNHAKTHLQACAALGRISGGTDHALQGEQP